MQRKAIMVREYTSQQDFHADEQKLSREGWSVEPTARDEQPGMLARLRARFTRGATPSSTFEVTYSRQQPS